MGASAFVTTRMSAISRMPALIACTSSPSPGGHTTTLVSASDAMSTSDWPGAHRLDDHEIEARGVEHVDHALRGAAEARRRARARRANG